MASWHGRYWQIRQFDGTAAATLEVGLCLSPFYNHDLARLPRLLRVMLKSCHLDCCVKGHAEGWGIKREYQEIADGYPHFISLSFYNFIIYYIYILYIIPLLCHMFLWFLQHQSSPLSLLFDRLWYMAGFPNRQVEGLEKNPAAVVRSLMACFVGWFTWKNTDFP